MRSSFIRTLSVALAVALLGASAGYSQNPAPVVDPQRENPPSGTGASDPQFQKRRSGTTASDQEYRLRKAAAQERIERLRKDAARLLQVATELKKYTDKTNENVLSLEVVRKAEEMERLARDLKNRMKAE